jgi:hypothetical protein
VPILRKGIVAKTEKDELLLDAFIFPGNSGGPALYSSFLGAVLPIRVPGQLSGDFVIGLVDAYKPYQDVAISQQTGRPRVSFEENSGLAVIVPADAIIKLVLPGLAGEI